MTHMTIMNVNLPPAETEFNQLVLKILSFDIIPTDDIIGKFYSKNDSFSAYNDKFQLAGYET